MIPGHNDIWILAEFWRYHGGDPFNWWAYMMMRWGWIAVHKDTNFFFDCRVKVKEWDNFPDAHNPHIVNRLKGGNRGR